MSGFLYAKLKCTATAERGKIIKYGKIKKCRAKLKGSRQNQKVQGQNQKVQGQNVIVSLWDTT
nr:MAG TPA: hypothetical protein [Caudoviricetes sp.]